MMLSNTNDPTLLRLVFSKEVKESNLNINNIKITIDKLSEKAYEYEIGKASDNLYMIKLYF